MGGRLYDWLGSGLYSARPTVASMAGLLGSPGSTAFFFSTDNSVLSIYDESGPSWFEINAASLSAIAFLTLPDVDNTGLVDGQVFKWDATATKMVPLSLQYQDAESIQDLVGAMLANGTFNNAVYDDTAGTITFNSTLTQYTDEMAQDAIAAMLAAGTNTGLTVTYNDATNSMSITVDGSWVDARADARIAVATMDQLADVNYPSAPTNGYVPVWNGTTHQWEPGPQGGVALLDDLTDVDTTTNAPATDGLFVFNGSLWVPRTPIKAFKVVPPVAADFSTQRNGGGITAATIVNSPKGKGVRMTFQRNSVGSSWRQSYLLKAAPAGNFRAEARLFSPIIVANNWYMFGLGLGNTTDTTKHVTLCAEETDNGAYWLFPWAFKHSTLTDIEANQTTQGSPLALTACGYSFWMAIEYDGTNINSYASFDGRTWWLAGSEPATFFTVAPNLIGFAWEAVSSDGGTHYVWCDHFRITTNLSDDLGLNYESVL